MIGRSTNYPYCKRVHALQDHLGAVLLTSPTNSHKPYQFDNMEDLMNSVKNVIVGEENGEAIFILCNIAGQNRDCLCAADSAASDLVIKSSTVGTEIAGLQQGFKTIEVAGGALVKARQWTVMLPTRNESHLRTRALEMSSIIKPIEHIAGLDAAIETLHDEYKEDCRNKGISPLSKESLPSIIEGELDCLLGLKKIAIREIS